MLIRWVSCDFLISFLSVTKTARRVYLFYSRKGIHHILRVFYDRAITWYFTQCLCITESNKPDSKFCAKCRLVLTYDAYSETVIEHQEKEDQILGQFESYSALVFASIPRIQTTIRIQVYRKQNKAWRRRKKVIRTK
jgi:hypothetical protein